jgi:hypothetical protein
MGDSFTGAFGKDRAETVNQKPRRGGDITTKRYRRRAGADLAPLGQNARSRKWVHIGTIVSKIGTKAMNLSG